MTDSSIVVRRERRAVNDVLIASVLFGACNIAWRYGSGPAIGIVGFRTAIGAVVALLIARRRGADPWTAPLRVRSGRWSVLLALVGLVAAGTMFRTLDGPLAGLAVACIPAVALLVRDRSGRLAVLAALGSSLAAVIGLTVASGGQGVGSVSIGAALLVASFIAIDVATMRVTEVAVLDGVDPTSIVSASMMCGAIVLLPIGLVFGAARDPAAIWGALGAALAVALFGTFGRVMRTAALPSAGVTATAASSQVNALVTAIGGIVLFGDHMSIVSVVCTAAAAGLGATAVIAAARWRLSRRPDLADVLDD